MICDCLKGVIAVLIAYIVSKTTQNTDGALLVQFGLRTKKLAVGILIFSILINIGIKAGVFMWLPGSRYYLGILASVFAAIGVTLATYKSASKEK